MKIKHIWILTLFFLLSVYMNSTANFLLADSFQEGELNPSQVILRSTPSNYSFYSQPVILSAHVLPTHIPAPLPSGTAEFKINNVTVAKEPLVNGIAKFTTTSLPESSSGNYITVVYLGDDKYMTSGDYLFLKIFPANTTLQLTSSSHTSYWGKTISILATAEAISPATATPEGSIQFKINDKVVAKIPLDANGQAVFSTADISAGDHVITASYEGNDNFNIAQANWVQHVKKADTTTTIAQSDEGSTFGQDIPYTVTVISGVGIPTGEVQVQVDGKLFGSPYTLDSDGKASITIKDLGAGPHVVTANYEESVNFNSSSVSLKQNVNKLDTHTTVTSSTNPSLFGENVMFTAIVDASKPVTGKVQFKVDGKNVSSPVKLNDKGEASLIIPNLPAGTQKVEVFYLGDNNLNPSNASLDQQVNKRKTKTEVISSEKFLTAGNPLELKAVVTTIKETPTGTVQFIIDGEKISHPIQLRGDAQASFTFNTAEVGEHKMTAIYSGDVNFEESTSAPMTISILSSKKELESR